MKWKLSIVLVAAAVLLVTGAAASAKDVEAKPLSRIPNPGRTPATHETARLETLWFFDADFSTTTGDNAGWTAYDRSGTEASANFWHHDTIRLDGHAELGDSTWWCGTYNICWRQARGYGNNWLQVLERHFTEAASADAGSVVRLQFDHRFAMEKDYDYGYVDVRSAATSDTWYTVQSYTNFGFAGTPGLPTQWGSAATPDQSLDLSPYVVDGSGGMVFDIRFRFESDTAYSPQDQFNNAQNSVKDGAWQIDNITLDDDGTPVYTDDSESYGDNGWVHDDIPASGQTGVTFWRGQFGVDFITGRLFTCDDRPVGTWMYAAVDLGAGTMVDDQYSWIMSPPIDISGADKLAGLWDQWFDLPEPSGDYADLLLASNDIRDCVTDIDGFVDEEPGGWFGGPFWGTWDDNWDAFAGNDWLAIVWEQAQDEEGTVPHRGGVFYNWQKVGIPSSDPSTVFELDFWRDFNDWSQDQLLDALADTAEIMVSDDDDVASVLMHASNDGGLTWESYSCRREDPQSNIWIVPPPTNQITPGVEIHYYFSATDGVGNVGIDPDDAPDHYYEFSILPILGSVSDGGILLVDKHLRPMPGETRDDGVDGLNYERPLLESHSQYYYAEMLTILGYEYDVFDVDVESGSNDQSNGPDSSAYKYYDTQIWFTNEFDTHIIDVVDQQNLISWLNQSGEGKERNLLMTGNDIGYELMEVGRETMSFYETWLASHYVEDAVGSVTVDSVPTLRDHSGGYDFMTHDDGQCLVIGGCPLLGYFDVVEPSPGITGTETVADYIKQDTSVRPAGVAYTHSTLGYKTVNLGFGMEFMVDSRMTSPPGYFNSGVYDRTDLMQNIMDYFGKTPDGPGTGVVDGGLRNALSHAYPNPFNPVTKIAYSVKESGPVSIEVYNVAGRVVRTLLSEELDAGTSGYVVWDGRGDGGEKCASGVYFYRIAAPGFSTSRKMVMLK